MMETQAHLDGSALALPPMPYPAQTDGVPRPSKEAESTFVFGTFLIGETEFAFSVSALREVVKEPTAFTRILPSPDYFLGMFNLRGLVVPVIDLRLLLGLAPGASALIDRKVAIIEHGQHCFGLLVDGTGDVFTAKKSDHYPFASTAAGADRAIISGVCMRGQDQTIVQVLDPGALLDLDHIPKVKAVFGIGNAETGVSKRRQCLSFHVAGSVCAIDVNCVKEIVDFEKIDNLAIASEWTLGTIDLRGTTVPVVDLQSFLSGKDERTAESLSGQSFKMVILQVGTELLSFLVDAISNIVQFREDDVATLPPVGLRRGDLFKGCLGNDKTSMVLLLDQDKVVTDEELVSVSAGCRELFRDTDASIRADHERAAKDQTYITFTIQSEFALDIRNVNEVQNFPDQVTRPPNIPHCIEGLLNLRGDLIPIINPRSLYGLEPIAAELTKLIIFSNNESKYGIMVDSVGAIVNVSRSDTRSMPPFHDRHNSNFIDNDVQEILVVDGDPAQQRSLVILDLEAILARCAAQT